MSVYIEAKKGDTAQTILLPVEHTSAIERETTFMEMIEIELELA